MVPSMKDEVHVQLHDVTGKVQHARLIVAVQRCARCELLRWTRILNLKRIDLECEKNRPRFRVDMIPWAGVKPPVPWAQDKPLGRGMG